MRAFPLRAVPALLATAVLTGPAIASAQEASDAPAPPGDAAPAAAPPEGSAPAAPPGRLAAESSAQAESPAKSDDLGLEWVWLNADLGYSYMDVKSGQLAISPGGSAPTIAVVDSTNAGLAYDFGAGVRLLFLTVGLRARNHTAMNLWQIDGEVGFHGRIGRVDPYLVGRFGYDTVGTLGQSVSVAGGSATPPDVSVHGLNGGLGLGFDYYLAHAVSLGAELAGDVVYLKRDAANPPTLTPDQQKAFNAAANDPQAYAKLQQAYQASASSVGFGVGGFVHLGVHF